MKQNVYIKAFSPHMIQLPSFQTHMQYQNKQEKSRNASSSNAYRIINSKDEKKKLTIFMPIINIEINIKPKH